MAVTSRASGGATTLVFSLVFLLVLFAVIAGSETGRPEKDTPGTLEDIYGDTGNTFQAAIGFVNFEGTEFDEAQPSYGLAVDDVVVKWREFELAPDVTDCATGSCAAIELATTNVYEGRAVLAVTVLETTPDAANDCDLDGVSDATVDCSGNGIPDLVVKATSESDIAGDIVFLDRIAAGVVYEGSVPISTFGDSQGVVFINPRGGEAPTVTVTYLDHDDGTGSPCANHVDPTKHGYVQAAATVFVGETCDLRVFSAVTSDNGDHDVFVDTNETVSMRLELVNNCGIDLHNCVAHLFTDDPKVDCILRSVVPLGDLEASSPVVLTGGAFVWKLGAVERTDVEERLFADFDVAVTCDEIDAPSAPQSVSVELDLDLDHAGETPVAWEEGFEGGSLASSAFFAENLDNGLPGTNNLEGLFYSEGWRCQYADPDWPASNSYGDPHNLNCYPGMDLNHAAAIWWQVDGHDTDSPDGGRARSGEYSLYYGSYLTDEVGFTTPMAAVESVATTAPINLGPSPRMSFWHQISLVDGRFANCAALWRSADRGVVQIKTVDEAGHDLTPWIRLEPFQNTYESVAEDNYRECTFDPVDDGNDEDDFFDPTDPNRDHGPSSTCNPVPVYACVGDTDDPFRPSNICRATLPPSADEAGSLGIGTWVESRVDLKEFRGRRVKLRFLVSSIKASEETHDEQFSGVNPGPWDDGWWIDDVAIDKTLASPADMSIDTNVLRHCAGDATMGCLTSQDCADAGVAGPCEGEAPPCGPTCTGVTAAVATDPDRTGGPWDEVLVAPGRTIEMNAVASHGTCVDGVLQFRFSVDGGSELRGWSDDPVDVDVGCPASGNLNLPFSETILAGSSKVAFTWTAPLDFDLFSGDLDAVDSYAGDLSTGSGDSFPATAVPATGEGFYYVMRGAGEFCNDVGLWTSEGLGESPLRESSLP
jgi:hypothetical protein